MGTRALGIYLNDHLAGATAGVDLARRTARGHTDERARTVLAQYAAEIAEDRECLLRFMAALEIPVRRYKVAGGWLAEKAGRLKLNGRLVGRAPLSDLLELELLRLGVEGKAAGWRALRERAVRDTRLDVGELDALISRAEKQIHTLEELRTATAAEVFE